MLNFIPRKWLLEIKTENSDHFKFNFRSLFPIVGFFTEYPYHSDRRYWYLVGIGKPPVAPGLMYQMFESTQ